MRMAYGYQYLYGQEEKAIPYARRWAELDPEDENACLLYTSIDLESGRVRGYNCDYADLEEIAENFSSLLPRSIRRMHLLRTV